MLPLLILAMPLLLILEFCDSDVYTCFDTCCIAHVTQVFDGAG